MGNPIKFTDLFDKADIDAGIKGLKTEIQTLVNDIKTQMQSIRDSASGLGSSMAGGSSATKSGRDTTRAQADEADRLYNAYTKLDGICKTLSTQLDGLSKAESKNTKAIEALATANDKAADVLEKLKANAELAKIALEGMVSSGDTAQIKQLQQAVSVLEKQVAKLTKAEKDNSSSKGNSAKSNVSLMQSYASLSGLIQKTGVDLNSLGLSEKAIQQIKKQGEIANVSAAGSYNQLAAQYNLVKIALNAMGEEMRNDTKIGQAWEAQALELMNKMKGMQEATGKHTLSVGDYGKAMNGLNIATKQVLREMPTLANSVNTFFIAISNNIPIFVDALKNAKKEVGSFKKVMKELVTGQFLLEGALLITLTLLSKYGQQWLSQIKIFRNANKELAKLMETHRKLFGEYDNVASIMRQEQKMQEDVYQRRIDLLKAQNAPLQDIQAAENALLNLRRENLDVLKKQYKDNLLGTDAIADYTKNVYALTMAQEKLRFITEKATAEAKRGGELRKRDKQAIEAQQKVVDNLKARVDAAEEVISAERDLALATSEASYRQYAERYAQYQKELQLQRDTENIALSLVEDRYRMERKIAIRETERQIEDIRDILNKAPEWLSDEQRAQYEKQIGLLGEALKIKLIESFHDEEETIISLRNKNNELRIGLMKEGQEKEIAAIREATRQRREELMRRYLYERGLTKEEKDNIIKQWQLTGKEGAQAESGVILDYVQRDLQTALNYKLAVYEDSYNNEYLLNKASIKAQIQYWKDYLENIKKYGNLSAAELENITTIVNTEILRLGTQGKRNRISSLFDFLNIDSDAMANIEDAFGKAIDYMNEWMDKRIEMAEVAVQAAEKETEATKTALDTEMEARANGYANNVELARKEYEEKVRAEKKAIAEKEKLQKIQEGIDSAQQASSLITATANIISAYSGLVGIGQFLSIAAIAAMWGMFAAAKVQAAQMTTYGEGMGEYLDYGGSHASGNDIDFGRSKDGKRRRVERGEVIGVINKRNVRKYGVGNVLGIINALNNGTYPMEDNSNASLMASILRSNALLGSSLSTTPLLGESGLKGLKMADIEANYGMAFSGLNRGTDLSSIEQGIGTLVEQGETRVVQTANGRIEYRGNNKRIIRNG